MSKFDKSKIIGIICAILSNILFGCSVAWTKESLIGYTPISASFGRIFFAVIFLIIYALITRKLQVVKKKDIAYFILGGLFLPFLFYIFMFEGMNLMDAIITGIFFSGVSLIISPFIASILFKESFRHIFFVGIIISMIGVVFALTNNTFHLKVSLLGLILVFFGAVSYVLYSMVVRHLGKDYTPTNIILYCSFVGLIFLTLALIYDWPNYKEASHLHSSGMAIFYMGVFSSFIGFILYAKSIKILGAGRALLFTSLVPVSGAISSVFILHEAFTVHKLLGLILVILGLYISHLPFKSNRFNHS